MTKAEAIVRLKGLYGNGYPKQEEALDMAISALSDYDKMQKISLDLAFENDELMNELDSIKNGTSLSADGDCISRQAVLDRTVNRNSIWNKITDSEGNNLEDILNSIPTAENKGEWIPVTERLPEDHKDVLICLSSDQICIGCYNSHRLPFSNNAIGWGASYTHNWCSNDVIAWMPLPEPYKKGGEE